MGHITRRKSGPISSDALTLETLQRLRIQVLQKVLHRGDSVDLLKLREVALELLPAEMAELERMESSYAPFMRLAGKEFHPVAGAAAR